MSSVYVRAPMLMCACQFQCVDVCACVACTQGAPHGRTHLCAWCQAYRERARTVSTGTQVGTCVTLRARMAGTDGIEFIVKGL